MSLINRILDFFRFFRQISTSSSKLLEVHRAQLVEMAVPANSIVETFNRIATGRLTLALGRK